jgi:hypothetical protein
MKITPTTVGSGMPRLDLDHADTRNATPWMPALLMLTALLVAADAAFQYRSLGEAVSEREARLARTSGVLKEVRTGTSGSSPEEYAAVRRIIQRMVTPWDRLFAAIEAAQTEGTALLSIEPDAQSGKVLLSGEARDYLSLLSYTSTLGSVEGLRDIHLTRHEARTNAPNRPVAFVISASWGTGQ